MSTDRPTSASRLAPESLRGYQRSWLKADIIAGLTLAAVAIPETMGYTSIAQVPVDHRSLHGSLPGARLRAARLLPAPRRRCRLRHRSDPRRRPRHPRDRRAHAELAAVARPDLADRARVRRPARARPAAAAGVPRRLPVRLGADRLPHRRRASRSSPASCPTCSGSPRAKGGWFEQQWSTLTHLGDTSLPARGLRPGSARDHPRLQALRARRSRARSSRSSCRSSWPPTLQVSSHGVAIVGPRCRAASRRSGCPTGSRLVRRAAAAGRGLLVLRPHHRPERRDLAQLRHRDTASGSTSTATSSV